MDILKNEELLEKHKENCRFCDKYDLCIIGNAYSIAISKEVSK